MREYVGQYVLRKRMNRNYTLQYVLGMHSYLHTCLLLFSRFFSLGNRMQSSNSFVVHFTHIRKIMTKKEQQISINQLDEMKLHLLITYLINGAYQSYQYQRYTLFF